MKGNIYRLIKDDSWRANPPFDYLVQVQRMKWSIFGRRSAWKTVKRFKHSKKEDAKDFFKLCVEGWVTQTYMEIIATSEN